MAKDDIRVRLSPEGTADVVRALRAVTKEAELASKKQAGVVSAIASDLKSLLPSIGIASAVTAISLLTKGTLDYADAMGKAATRTGASAENFSVLAFAAKTADVEIANLEAGLVRTARSVDQLRGGSGEQADALRELGFAARDFEGLDTAQSFTKIAERLAKVEDQTERTTKAVQIFSRNGAGLLTLMQDLSEKGFDAVAREARRMGLIIGDDVAKAAAAANDSFTLIGQQAKGLATQFVTGLAEPVADAMQRFTDATSGAGTDGMQELGKITGKVINGITRGFLIAGETVGLFTALLQQKAANLGATLGDLGRQAAAGGALGAAGGAAIGSVVPGVGTALGAGAGFLAGAASGAVRSLTRPTPGAQEQIDLLGAFRDRVAEIMDETKPEEINARAAALRRLLGAGSGDDGNAKTLAQQLAVTREKAATDELKVLEDAARRRRQIVEEQIALEQQHTQAIVASQGDTVAAQQRISAAEQAALQQRVQAIRDAHAAESQLITARTAALTAAAQREFADAKVVQQLQTQITREATQARIDLEAKRVNDLTRMQTEYLKRYQDSMARIRAIDQEVADASAARRRIEADASSARLTEEQRNEEALARLQDARAKIGSAATRGAVEEARQLNAEALQLFQQLANAPGFESVAKRLSDEIGEFFKITLDGQRNVERSAAQAASAASKTLDQQLGDALKAVKELQAELTKGAIVSFKTDDQSVRTLLADLQKAFDETPLRVKVASSAQPFNASPAFAGGGYVPGSAPHPRADNVLARVTSGEFIQQVAAVRHYGVGFMRDVNAMRYPRFADGGLVGDVAAANEPERDVVDVNINIGGRVVKMQSRREQAHALVDALASLQQGTMR